MAPGWLSQHTQYIPQVPSRHTFWGEPDLPGVPRIYPLLLVRSKRQRQGASFRTGLANPGLTRMEQPPCSIIQISCGVWGLPPGARLKLPEWDGSLLSLPSPLLKGRRGWNTVQASAHGTEPSVGPALTCVWIHTYSSGLHFEGAPEMQGRGLKTS